MQSHKKYHKYIAIVMVCIFFLLQLPTMPVWASDAAPISIASQEDWDTFVKNCKLDTWSKGKSFRLDTDLDLGGKFQPVPIFSGNFDGNGHTIHIGSYTKAGSDTGLFRYIQSGAVVKNLTVTGTWQPSGQESQVGGIVGHNSGVVQDCLFNGLVKGKNNIGGIAGINEAGATIRGCTVRGSMQGEHYTGGVAGQNLGMILRCSNESSVNIEGTEITPTLDDIDVTDLNNTENLSAYTDTGGIAGFSSGWIESCQNIGQIGYPHVGYNVGGIAGRQTGYLCSSENKGEIYGRKDIGGIVGQMEPYMILQFGQDDLQRLSDAFSDLQDIMDQMIDHTEGSMDTFNIRMDSISALSDMAKDSTDDLVHRTEDYVDDTVNTVNDLAQRADRFLAEMERIGAQGQTVAEDIDKTLELLEKSITQLQGAVDNADSALSYANDAVSEISSALTQYNKALNALTTNARTAAQAIRNLDIQGALAALEAMQSSFYDLQQAGDRIHSAVNSSKDDFSDMVDTGQDASDDLQSSLNSLERSIEQMQVVQDGLSDMIAEFRWAITLLRDGGTPQLSNIDPEYREQVDTLLQRADDLFFEFGQLRTEMTEQGDILLNDMRALNDQMRVIMDIMTDMYQALLEPKSQEDVFEDISEENTNLTEGVVRECSNYGTIEGDVDTGGICGAMAIEYDFDPEDDLTRNGESTMDRKYQTKAVLEQATNYGTVTGKKDDVGGIVGYMQLGSVRNCTAYGWIESENGDYVGGIVGHSQSTIRNCAAKVSASGNCYVGGIAGYGMDIAACCAMVDFPDAQEAVGAIAGKADGVLQNNIFAECDWGGVDDISLSNQAEPMAYADFLELPEIPERFHAFYLTFISNGAIIAELAYEYGARTDSQEIPAVPTKEGYTGEWEDLPEIVTFDRILEPIYTQYRSSIASEQMREDGKRPVLLVEGSFQEDMQMQMASIAGEDVAYTGIGTYLEGWNVTLPQDGIAEHTFSYCQPEGIGFVRLYEIKGDAIEPIATEKNGQYLSFDATGDTISFFAVRISYLVVIVPLSVLVLILLAVILYHKRKAIQQKIEKHHQKKPER